MAEVAPTPPVAKPVGPSSEWNDTARNYPTALLHELFEAQAALTPEAIAVQFRDAALTYKELNERANQLAHRLVALGTEPDTLVAICMDRSVEMVVSLYAILKSGAAYVPIDPEYPADRVSFMLRDADAAVLLTQEHLSDRLSDSRMLTLTDLWEGMAAYPIANLALPTSADDLAYVIYTSGSTGRPKGAMITHRAITNRIQWMQEAYRLKSDDRVLQKTPFSFDVSVWEFFWPLLFGAQLEVAEPGGHRDSTYLVNTIVEREITTIHFVPSMLQLFLEDPRAGDCKSLRRVICSGEALPKALQDLFFSRLGSELHNLYGPTEAAVDVTAWACDPDSDLPFVPIGEPVANTQIHILDDNMAAVPIGSAGELHIGGVQVGLGYLNRTELTAERFIDDPFSDVPKARLYKTGDLARYMADGNIEFLGRMDNQVKIRGFRIELGEIEAALDSHPAVSRSVVTALESSNKQTRLVAYIEPDPKRAHTLRKVVELDKQRASRPWTPYELPNGLIVSHLNRGETDYTYKEIFEENTYFKHGIRLDRGACVFDVGANIGLFALFVGSSMPNAEIFSFEPIRPIYDVLAINATLYPFQITPLQYGLSNKTGEEPFTYYPHVSIMSGRFADLDKDKETVKQYLAEEQLPELETNDLSVEMLDDLLTQRLESETYQGQLRTLSEVIRELSIERIDLLKIDAEKSELEVLQGISPEDWNKIEQIVAEVHDIDNRRSDCVALLESNGYHVVVERGPLLQLSDLVMVYAVRSDSDTPTEASEAPPAINPDFESQLAWLQPSGLIGELRSFVGSKLPEYMIPNSFTILNEIPLTPNGKLDRKALPAPNTQRPSLAHNYVAPQTDLQRRLCEMWQEILALEQVGIHDRFFELGGTSLQAASFVNRLQRELGEFIYVVTIFGAPTIAEYASLLQREYPTAVMETYGVDPPHSRLDQSGSDTDRPVSKEMLDEFRQFVPTSATGGRSPATTTEKNPPVMFILGAPRSGTTLLRVMLAGHPGLFAAPELQLLGFDTLEERRQAYQGKFSAWAEGTVRTLMAIHDRGADEAKRIMAEYEANGMSTKDFYRTLQESIGDRILVDKSPSYALDPASLQKAERDFDEPRYIHVVRHPYSMVKSFERIHMHQALFLRDHPFGPRQLGELVWTLSNQNISEFLASIPDSRKFILQFEDLATDPSKAMESLCETLGIQFHPGLLEPYQNPAGKMTDGLYPESTPMGDIRFHEHHQIDGRVADAWQGVISDDFLGDITWSLATSLGYERILKRPRSQEGSHAKKQRSRDRRERQLRTRRKAGP